jgi:manganese/zinc/iron transport system permease protein
MSEFMMFSLIPMTVAVIIGMTCALLGNFLVLRRQSLIGDAISHVALPGIVVSFLLTGMLSSTAMMLGAGASALITVAMIELIRRLGRVEISAAMGVTFTSLFAVGVLLLEWHQAGGVHLDVEHALYGNLESLIWFEGSGPAALLDPLALADLPPQLARVAWVGIVVALFVVVFRRHLIIASFDPDFAASVQARPVLVDLLLVTLVAIAAIAAFEAVGSIIVIAMFICPAAAARLITDRLSAQIAWSQLFAVVSSVLGYLLAGHGPGWIGFDVSLSAAGMIASLTGVILLLACLLGPYRQAEGARQES